MQNNITPFQQLTHNFLLAQRKYFELISKAQEEYLGNLTNLSHQHLNGSIEKLESLHSKIADSSMPHAELISPAFQAAINNRRHLQSSIVHHADGVSTRKQNMRRLAMGVFAALSLTPAAFGASFEAPAANDGSNAATATAVTTSSALSSLSVNSVIASLEASQNVTTADLVFLAQNYTSNASLIEKTFVDYLAKKPKLSNETVVETLEAGNLPDTVQKSLIAILKNNLLLAYNAAEVPEQLFALMNKITSYASSSNLLVKQCAVDFTKLICAPRPGGTFLPIEHTALSKSDNPEIVAITSAYKNRYSEFDRNKAFVTELNNPKLDAHSKELLIAEFAPLALPSVINAASVYAALMKIEPSATRQTAAPSELALLAQNYYNNERIKQAIDTYLGNSPTMVNAVSIIKNIDTTNLNPESKRFFNAVLESSVKRDFNATLIKNGREKAYEGLFSYAASNNPLVKNAALKVINSSFAGNDSPIAYAIVSKSSNPEVAAIATTHRTNTQLAKMIVDTANALNNSTLLSDKKILIAQLDTFFQEAGEPAAKERVLLLCFHTSEGPDFRFKGSEAFDWAVEKISNFTPHEQLNFYERTVQLNVKNRQVQGAAHHELLKMLSENMDNSTFSKEIMPVYVKSVYAYLHAKYTWDGNEKRIRGADETSEVRIKDVADETFRLLQPALQGKTPILKVQFLLDLGQQSNPLAELCSAKIVEIMNESSSSADAIKTLVAERHASVKENPYYPKSFVNPDHPKATTASKAEHFKWNWENTLLEKLTAAKGEVK